MFTVPIDVISQHMMLTGQKAANDFSTKSTKTSLNNQNAKLKELERIQVPDKLKQAHSLRIAHYISKEIYKQESLKGFYRGYFLSTFLVSINSALWWPFYYFYQGNLRFI